jgi:kumamolisin
MTEDGSRQTHTVLRDSLRTHRPGSEVLGRADAHEWCEITVKLRRRKELPEPIAGRPIAGDLARFGAQLVDIDAVTRVLKRYGLTIVSAEPAARAVTVAAPAATMERTFGVHLLRVKHGSRIYRGRVGCIHIPKGLEGMVTGVFGLDTRPMTSEKSARTPKPASVRPGRLPAPGDRAWYLPQELAKAYEFPDNAGEGQTIGIIELKGRYVANDLDEFCRIAGVGAAPQVIVTNVETLSRQDSNDSDAIKEVMLDIEVLAAVCPRATLAVYFSNFTEKGWIHAIDAALRDAENPPSVLSVSYGYAEGEYRWTAQAMSEVNDAFKEAAARGIPVSVAAGDDGSDDQIGDGMAHVHFPASSPYVLGVGGTALRKIGRKTDEEVVWFEGNGLIKDHGGSTGGGVSAVFGRPAWQRDIAIRSVNPHAPAGRCVPDVAANAARGTGYFMIAHGQQHVVGGTSASAPLWAGLLARLKSAGKPVGYVTPLFYKRRNGKPLGPFACNDITQGDNVTCAAGGYQAGKGYDAVTGWGTPNGRRLMHYL